MKDLLKQAQSKDANERFLAVLQLGKQEHSRKAHVLAASLMQDPRDKWMRPAVYNALSKGAPWPLWISSGHSRIEWMAQPGPV